MATLESHVRYRKPVRHTILLSRFSLHAEETRRAAEARNNPPRQCATNGCRVLTGRARWRDAKRGRLARLLRTERGAFWKDAKPPVFTTRALTSSIRS
jgi:hypothetical protein